jgi:hypothetical protein
MNQLKRRLPGVLLALVLLVLPAAAHGEPLTGSLDRWTTTVLDLLADLFDLAPRTTVDAASETGGTGTVKIEGTEPGFAPTMDPNGADLALRTTGFAPTMDPNG